MAPFRDEKMIELIKHLGAKFLQEESGPSSLITVTKATWNEKTKSSTIYFTAFPEEKEKTALLFAKRKRSDFREYFKEHSRTRSIPIFDFEIDLGEKNRQKIDELSKDI
ncbi:MAG: hypothetical protein HQ402_03870 [Parcubacteria group bacterium]|nr:hypothetical protein [Parcubacteria group bacterium]